jgi:hypothetical protein
MFSDLCLCACIYSHRSQMLTHAERFGRVDIVFVCMVAAYVFQTVLANRSLVKTK